MVAQLTKKNADAVLTKLAVQVVSAVKDGDTALVDALMGTLLKLATFPDAAVGAAVRIYLNEMLNNLRANDVFGTEGQFDPRSNSREGT